MMQLIKLLKPIVEKFPSLAAFYRIRKDAKAMSMPPEYRRALGFKFNGPVAMQNGVFEPEETELIKKILPNVSHLINVGANTGYYCLYALQAEAYVIAFEPDKINSTILLKNVEANRWQNNFELLPLALSDKLGILPLYGASTGASLIKGWAGQSNSELVPTNTLDNLVGGRTFEGKCLILIDIEGAEYECLKGAKTLLSRNDQMIFFVEISIGEHQPKGININPNLQNTFRLFDSYGYRAYAADNNLREIHLSEIEKIDNTGIDTMDVHNFIFIHKNTPIASILT